MANTERPLISFKTISYGALGVASIAYYGQFGSLYVGQYYFGHSLPQFFHFSVIALLTVLTITAIGCSVHLQALGGFERNELQSELARGLNELKNLKDQGHAVIEEVEHTLPLHVQGLTSRGEYSLRVLKQILHSIEVRLNKVEKFAEDGSMPALCQGVDLIRKKIRTIDSAHDSIIDIDPLPAIPSHKLPEVLNSLSQDILSGLRKAA